MNLVDARALGLAAILRHKLDGWKFAFDHSKVRFGCCKYRTRTISLSKALAAMNPEVEVRDVVLHEVAHALAGAGAGHGRQWKACASSIGAKPERCYDSSKVARPKAKHLARCKKCNHSYPRHKRWTGKRICGLCRGPLEWVVAEA